MTDQQRMIDHSHPNAAAAAPQALPPHCLTRVMTLSWELLTIAVTVLMAVAGGLWGLVRMLLGEVKGHIDTKFSALDGRLQEAAQRAHDTHQALQDFKLYVAEQYVHRDDWVRVQGSGDIRLRKLEEKIDDLRDLID